MNRHPASASSKHVPHTASASIWPTIDRIVVRAAAVLIVISWSALVVHIISALLYPYPLDYGEGPVLATARTVVLGQPIYRDLTQPPWLSANYPPMYYLLNASAIALFGPVLWPGRLLSVAGMALTAGAITAEIWRLTGRRSAALLGTGLFLALGPVASWGVVVKADALALGLACAGLAGLGRRRILMGSALLLAAVLTKQSLLTAWLAGLIWIGWQARARPAVAMQKIAVLIGGLAGSVALLEALSAGQFLTHTVVGNLQSITLAQTFTAVRFLVEQYPVLLALGALGFILTGRTAGLQTPWQPAIVIAWLALLVSVGKAGAYTNYYLETLAGSCVFAGLAWSRGRTSIGPRAVGLAGLLLVQAALLLRIPLIHETVPTSDAARRAGDRVIAAIQTADGPVLAERSAWLVLAGVPVEIDDPFFFAQLARQGRWRDDLLVQRLRAGAYRRLVLDFDLADPTVAPYHRERFTPAAMAAIEQRYATVDRVLSPGGDVWIFEPR